MKRILVLGGTQFFGKKLVEKLLEKGKQVTIATRGLTPDPFGKRVERIILDREHRGEMKQAFENKSWDVVYDQTCLSPEEAKEVIDALKGKVNRYILTSSQAVYPYGTNHKEENFDPFSYTYTLKSRREYSGYEGYQEAKRASEAVLFNEKVLQAVAVRMPIVIGEDDFTKRLQFHVDKVIKGEEIGIENGDFRYSFITSEEAAEFLYLLGEADFVGPINPGFKDDLSLSELIELIERTVGKKAVLTQEITPANVTPYRLPGSWSINNEKAEQLGFQFANQEKALVELIKFYSTFDA